ncbi:MAG: purine-nucleoside phosphorylase [Bacilli bacterium]|nr:purine-nucleoside phosphorylase [Bacilli bacterium]
MSLHINANKEDIAENILMCGDPLRAKHIAETYLEDYKEVCNTRNMLGFTGYYKGKRISVLSHGMGIPSAGIYTYELFTEYDVKNVIRIGTCGTISEGIDVRETVLGTSSFSMSNYVYEETKDTTKIMYPNDELNKVIEEEAKEENINLKKTRILTSDNFYGEAIMAKMAREKFDCGVAEMESFVIFYNAKRFNVNAACILTVVDNQLKEDILVTPEERETGLTIMTELALNAIIKVGD